MKKSKMKRTFQMAQRIQPDRQVKKKRKMEEPESFDIVGNFLYNYGLTGENLAHEIFSYLDFSPIQDSRLVCKSWNIFLSKDRKLWLEILRQTQPFFEFLSNQLSSNGEAKTSASNETKKNWIKEFFDSLEICSKSDNFSCQKMIQLFKKIEVVHALLQCVIHDCPDYKVFQKEFIGRKLAEEIQSEIDRADFERFRYPQTFLPWLQGKIRCLSYLQERLKSQEEENWGPNYICYDCGIDCHQALIQKKRDDIQVFKRELQHGIEKEFNSVLQAHKEAQKEEEVDGETRLGPGGLDPDEVFETLPDALKECFESQDKQRLQDCIKAMNQKDARYHMKRCVASGLWVPDANDPSNNPEDGFKIKRGAQQDS